MNQNNPVKRKGTSGGDRRTTRGGAGRLDHPLSPEAGGGKTGFMGGKRAKMACQTGGGWETVNGLKVE